MTHATTSTARYIKHSMAFGIVWIDRQFAAHQRVPAMECARRYIEATGANEVRMTRAYDGSIAAFDGAPVIAA